MSNLKASCFEDDAHVMGMKLEEDISMALHTLEVFDSVYTERELIDKHFNHRNANVNYIRGDTVIDGKVTMNGINCRDVQTGWNEKRGGSMEYLDRHNVECLNHESLTRIKLEVGGNGNNQIRYNYRCCKPN
jgi:hypothetical protein